MSELYKGSRLPFLSELHKFWKNAELDQAKTQWGNFRFYVKLIVADISKNCYINNF